MASVLDLSVNTLTSVFTKFKLLFHNLERWCRGHPCDEKQGNAKAQHTH